MSNVPPPPPGPPPTGPGSGPWAAPPAPPGAVPYGAAPAPPQTWPGGGGPWPGGPGPYGAPVPGQKPPRPATPGAAILTIAGAAVIVLGTLLAWVTIDGASTNAFDLGEFGADDGSRGAGLVVLAVVIGALGAAALAFRRNHAVAISVTIASAIVLVRCVVDIGNLNDLADVLGWELGPGAPVSALGGAMALGGSIWMLAIRRAWPAPAVR